VVTVCEQSHTARCGPGTASSLCRMPAPTDLPLTGFHAVVPAGGAGTRLWPLSRVGSPKFLHDLTGTGRTLLQGTVDRLLPLTGPGGVLVVTGERHATGVRDQLPEPSYATTLQSGVYLVDGRPKPAQREVYFSTGMGCSLASSSSGNSASRSVSEKRTMTS